MSATMLASARSRLAPTTVVLGIAALALPLAALAAAQPQMVPAAVLGAALLAVCALRADIALLLLIASIPLESAFQIGGGGQLSATKLVGALCFASFGLLTVATGRRIVLDRVDAILFALLAVALVSTVMARSASEAAATTFRYASFVGLYVVVTQLADRERLYERIIWVLTACSSIAAFLSVGRFLRGDALLAQSAYGNANDLAFILATTLPLSLWLLLRTRRSGKVLVAGMLGVISAGVVLSFSRGALLGLAVALAFYGVTERRHARLFLTGGLVIVVSTVLLVHTNTTVVTRGLNAKGHVAQYNVDTRLVAWSGALQLAADHPLVGIGPGNFGEYYYELTDSPPTVERLRVTHDAYLDVAAELGFTGVVLFLGYLAISFSRLSQAVRRRLGPPGLAPLVRAAMVVALVGMLTHSEEYSAPIWFLGALGTAMWREGSSGSSR